METNLQTLSDIELKALAYDHLVQLQQAQNNLNIINQELAKRATKPSPMPISQLNTPSA